MYYRCTNCNAAVQAPHGHTPEGMCTCKTGTFVRAERDRIYVKKEVFRSGGDHFKLNAARDKFVAYR